MVVGARIVDFTLPDKINPKVGFDVEIVLDTYGDGEDYIFAGVVDEDYGDLVIAGITEDKIPPDKRVTATGTIDPLESWYEERTGIPIPDTLRWKVVVGYAEKVNDQWRGHVTDESSVIEIPAAGAPGVIDWIREHKYEVGAASAGLALGVVVVAKRK